MRLHFQSARGLKNLETMGKSDPYVRVLLSGVEKGRTVTFKNNLNPDWDEVVYVPVHTIRERLTLEVMDEEKLGKDRSLGHVELAVGDYVQQDDNGEYLVHEQKQITPGLLRMSGTSAHKGTLNYTCSFYPTIPTWDPEEDEEESDETTPPNGLSPSGSIHTTGSKAPASTHARTVSGTSQLVRSETAGTISSLTPSSSHRDSAADLAKQLEKNEHQQDEQIPEKPKIEKLRLNAEDLQQYGKLRCDERDLGKYRWLSRSPQPTLLPCTHALTTLVWNTR
jgi:hypothetical protein